MEPLLLSNTIKENKLDNLLDILTKWNAKIIGNYDKIIDKTLINYECSCGINGSKKYCNIIKYGATCIECKKKLSIEKRKTTFYNKYGVDCILKLDSIKEQIKNTNIKKYGTPYTMQNNSVKEKTKNTFLKKYGVDNPNKSNLIIEKTKNTNLKKYGVTNPNKLEAIKEKTKNTNLKKYGVSCILNQESIRTKVINNSIEKYGTKYPIQSNIYKDKCLEKRKLLYGSENMFLTTHFKEKAKKTMKEKYGVEHALQSIDIFHKQTKSSYTSKDYILPSGKSIKVQGYEPFALNDLLKIYDESQIITDRKSIPRIKYIFNDKDCIYFPDFYIPHLNKIIEVKSSWTLKKDQNKNNLKKEASKKQGYDFELLVYDSHGKRIE